VTWPPTSPSSRGRPLTTSRGPSVRDSAVRSSAVRDSA